MHPQSLASLDNQKSCGNSHSSNKSMMYFQSTSTPASAFDLRDLGPICSQPFQPSASAESSNDIFFRDGYINHPTAAQLQNDRQPAGNAAESQQQLLSMETSGHPVTLTSISSLQHIPGRHRSVDHHQPDNYEPELDSILSGKGDLGNDKGMIIEYHSSRRCASVAATPQSAQATYGFISTAPTPSDIVNLVASTASTASTASQPATLLNSLIAQEQLLDFAATGCKLKEKLAQEHRDDGFLRTLEAVAKIVKNKLYLARAKNMESYFQGQYKISRAQVYRLLDCWSVIQELEGFEEKPLKQRICRVIKKLAPEVEKRRILWKAVLDEYSATKGVSNFTSADIRNKHNELAKDGVFAGFQDVPASAVGGEKKKRRRQANVSEDEEEDAGPEAETETRQCLETSESASSAELSEVKVQHHRDGGIWELGYGQEATRSSKSDYVEGMGRLCPVKVELSSSDLTAFEAACSAGQVGKDSKAATDNTAQARASFNQADNRVEPTRPPARKRQKKSAGVATLTDPFILPTLTAPVKAKRGRKPKSATPAMHPYAALLDSTPLSIGPMTAYTPAQVQVPASTTPGHLAIVIKNEQAPAVSCSTTALKRPDMQVKLEPCSQPEPESMHESQPEGASSAPFFPLTMMSSDHSCDFLSAMSTLPGSNSSSPLSVTVSDRGTSSSARASAESSYSPTASTMGKQRHDDQSHSPTPPRFSRNIDHQHQSPQVHGNMMQSSAAAAFSSGLAQHHPLPPPHLPVGTMLAHLGQCYSSHYQYQHAPTNPPLYHQQLMDPHHQTAFYLHHYRCVSQSPSVYHYQPPQQQPQEGQYGFVAEPPLQITSTVGSDGPHQEQQVNSALASPARRPLWTPYGDPWYS